MRRYARKYAPPTVPLGFSVKYGIPISGDVAPAFAGAVPPTTDVVVIGGGVVGVCTALFLARDGVRVVLLEKGRIAGEQSGRNWGWIRQQGRDPAELPIMVEANGHWQAFAREVNSDFGLRQAGVTYLARDAEELGRFEDWLPHAAAHGVQTTLLSRAEVGRVVRGLAGTCFGGIHTPSDLKAEPWLAVPALAGLAQRAGAVIVEGCAVRALDLQAGRVAGVVTEQGRIDASAVVLAGGAWSEMLLRRHDVVLPQLSVRASVAMTQPLPEICAGGAALASVAFRHRLDGCYSLAPGGFHELFLGPQAFRAAPKFWAQLKADPFGTRFKLAAPQGYPDAWGQARRWSEDQHSPFEAIRVLDPAPSMSKLRAVANGFSKLFPHLGPVHLRRVWAGMIDTLPDIVPVMDHVPALPGLTLGTGFSGHGFGIGPGAGRVLSALVQGKAPGHDISRFRFSRFQDGTKMDLGPAL